MATSIEVHSISSLSPPPLPPPPPPPPPPPATAYKNPLFLLNAALMLVGGSAGPLLLRLYFVHGGRRLWLSTLIQNCGCPLLLLPLSLHHHHHHLTLPLISFFAFLGVFTGLDCYLYALSSSLLPLSTSSLLVSSQLAFTAFFAFLIVRLRFTPFSANAVVLLTLGPAVLALGSPSDRPVGESEGRYYVGFAAAIAAAALIGIALPLIELAMRWCKVDKITYGLVMEMQLVIGVFGTGFCLVGMVLDDDFKVIPREAREFGLGETKYYMVLIWDAILWQLFNLGLVGIISSANSLFGGIVIAVLLPISELFAVIFLKEKFNGSKGVALAISLWGFASYLYGEKQQNNKSEKTPEVELIPSLQSL